MSTFCVDEPVSCAQEAMPPPPPPKSSSQSHSPNSRSQSVDSTISWSVTPTPGPFRGRVLQSIESSQSPTLSLAPTSKSQTPSITSSNQLNRDEKIILFQIIIKYNKAYFHRQKRVFWTTIQQEFKQETKKEHKTLQRVVEREVEEREEVIKNLGSGEELFGDTYTALVDQWSSIQKEYNIRKENSKKEEEDLRKEAEIACKDRQNLLLPRSKKTPRRSLTTSQDSTLQRLSTTPQSDPNDIFDTIDSRRESTAPPESPPQRKKPRTSQYTRTIDPADDRFLISFERAVEKLYSESHDSRRISELSKEVKALNTKLSAIFAAVVKGKRKRKVEEEEEEEGEEEEEED